MKRFLLSVAVVAGWSSLALAQSGDFALKKGDEVVFYGDSITDNSPYTYFVETFVTLRYPQLGVHFTNAGMGGDRVTGGGIGPIDVRLTRDLFSRKPTVITSMLGMNDGSYRPFDEAIFKTFRDGYQHIADRIKKEAPSARVYLIKPSPYDDVTRAVSFPDGYNSVLVKYGEYVGQLASSSGFSTIDLNTPLVTMLTKAIAASPENAAKIIPDRIHPAPGGHILMASEILKAWNASPVVSNTTIDFANGKATSVGAKVTALKSGSFTLAENSLPMPTFQNDPLTKLVTSSSDVLPTLNQETLTVTNLTSGSYTLKIDGTAIGTFSDTDFAKGIDLTLLNTPMEQQAINVFNLTRELGQLRYTGWRQLEVSLPNAPETEKEQAIKSLEKLEEALFKARAKAAVPTPHKFEIAKA